MTKVRYNSNVAIRRFERMLGINTSQPSKYNPYPTSEELQARRSRTPRSIERRIAKICHHHKKLPDGSTAHLDYIIRYV